MKQFFLRILHRLVWSFVRLFKWLSTTRFKPWFWESLYSSCVMGAGFRAYFDKRYKEAVSHFEEALNYADDYEVEMICERLGKIYDEGLGGVPVDKTKAAECFLRAGFNGDCRYLHAYAAGDKQYLHVLPTEQHTDKYVDSEDG